MPVPSPPSPKSPACSAADGRSGRRRQGASPLPAGRGRGWVAFERARCPFECVFGGIDPPQPHPPLDPFPVREGSPGSLQDRPLLLANDRIAAAATRFVHLRSPTGRAVARDWF